MPLILGIDCETSGLVATEDKIVEVGAVLFDWNTALPLVLQSDLVFAGVTLSKELTEIHGITDEMLEEYGKREGDAYSTTHALMSKADYVMAHFGASFDKEFFRETFSRLNIDWPDKLWLDSSIDIVYDSRITTRNLQYLAAEHGFLNPFRHRAVFDVLTMLRVASDYDLDKIVARAQEPTLYVQAIVSFDEKEKAKERGYRWFPAGKLWWKSAKQSDYLAERDTCGFRTVVLSGKPE